MVRLFPALPMDPHLPADLPDLSGPNFLSILSALLLLYWLQIRELLAVL